MSTTLQTRPARDEVPKQFVGMARQLRTIIDAEDDIATVLIKAITAPFKTRVRSHGVTFRTSLLIDTERAWCERIPPEGRVSLVIERTKTGLYIREVRASAGNFRFESWLNGNREPDIGLQEIKLIARPGMLEIDQKMLASIALHGLARRFQRGFDNSYAAIRADLRSIARHREEVLNGPPGKFSLPAGDGKWVGSTASATHNGRTTRVLSIRSFIGDGKATGVMFGR